MGVVVCMTKSSILGQSKAVNYSLVLLLRHVLCPLYVLRLPKGMARMPTS